MTFKPMLSATVALDELDTLVYPLFASVKLDGIRVVVRGGQVLTRNLTPVVNEQVQAQFGHLEHADGELTLGPVTAPDVFSQTNGMLKRRAGKYIDIAMNFHLFDVTHPAVAGVPYVDRCTPSGQHSQVWRDLVRAPHATRVQQLRMAGPEQVQAFLSDALRRGYEGAMLRALHGLYKHGRSTLREQHLVKLKVMETDEATIVGYEEQLHNGNAPERTLTGRLKRSSAAAGLTGKGTLGSLVVEDKPRFRNTFNIGSGFTDADRALAWRLRDELIGKKVVYRYQPSGTQEDAPRFPVIVKILP